MILIRPVVVLGGLLLGIALPIGAAHGGPSWPMGSTAREEPPDLPEWLVAPALVRAPNEASPEEAMGAAGLSDLDAMLLREAPVVSADSDPLTLTTSAEGPSDLRTLIGKGERWHLMRFGASATSPPEKAGLAAYGTVAYVPRSLMDSRADRGLGFGPLGAPASSLGLGLEDPQEPVSLGIRGQLDGLEGGAEYRAVGKRLERVVTGPPSQHDREGTEVWLAQRLGLLRLKLSQSDLSDNVDRDPALPRTNRTQTAVSAQLTSRGWPALGLTYATGRSKRVWLTDGGGAPAAELQSFDSLAGSASYGRPSWDVAATSTYAYSRDPGHSDRDMTMLYHDLTLTLRPLDSVTVMPSVSTGLDRYEWSGTTNQIGSASLLISYAPTTSWWSLWTLGAYTTSQASDRTVDGQTMTMSGGLVCGLGKLLGGPATLSVEAGYESYVDSVDPESSASGAFALVLVRVAAF
jgi:hypothetical protein